MKVLSVCVVLHVIKENTLLKKHAIQETIHYNKAWHNCSPYLLSKPNDCSSLEGQQSKGAGIKTSVKRLARLQNGKGKRNNTVSSWQIFSFSLFTLFCILPIPWSASSENVFKK